MNHLLGRQYSDKMSSSIFLENTVNLKMLSADIVTDTLKGLDTLDRFSAIFHKGDNFSDFSENLLLTKLSVSGKIYAQVLVNHLED